jgi:endonuclease-3
MAKTKINPKKLVSKNSASFKMERVGELFKLLKARYPDAQCSLRFRNPFELLVATVLSAQCTDDRVNKVTPDLFKKFPTPVSMAKGELADIEELIRSTGFFKNKAKSLKELSVALVANHQGQVPQDMEALTALRGVGRKTANVILGNAFGAPGFPVDTHVGRLTRRLGVTKATDPVKIEAQVTLLLPPENWTLFSHLLIDHGRAICMARNPQCNSCFLAERCPSKNLQNDREIST